MGHRNTSMRCATNGFEFVSGLADGASAMPAKWSRRVFSFRFYEGKKQAEAVGAITHAPTGCDEETIRVDGRQAMWRRQRDDEIAVEIAAGTTGRDLT